MTGTQVPKLIALTANSAQNLAHFRAPVIRALKDGGYRLAAIVPDDRRPIEGVESQVHVTMNRGGTNPLQDWATIRGYRAAFRRTAPAAILGFTPKANIYGAMAAQSEGVTFIPTVSGLGTAFLQGGLLRSVQTRLYSRAFSSCPMVLFQNSDDRDFFVAAGLTQSDRARVVPGSGIDLDRFTLSALPGQEKVEFLFIGRLLGDKGIRELAGAARVLRASGRSFGLTVVGDVDHGNPSAIREKEVMAWQDEGLLHWAGSQADVRPFIKAADVVVLPSYREGLPRSLLEAAAMGRPMVATDVAGCRELVISERTGLLCGARNVGELAHAMAAMMAAPINERSAMGQRARAMVEAKFDARIVGRHYLDLLAELGL